MTTTQTRRRRRSGLAADSHVIQRRGSARFHPLSNVFGLFDEPTGVDGSITDKSPGHHLVSSAEPIGQRRQLLAYTIEGGWTKGINGRYTYIETGRIEEVNDSNNEDNDDGNDDHNNNKNNTTHDMTAATRPEPSLSSLADSAGKRNTFGIPITDPLPPSATPPPCPHPDRISLLAFSSPRGMEGPSTFPFQIKGGDQPPPYLDVETERVLLRENLNLLSSSMRDLQILSTFFYAQTPIEPFDDHIECCTVLEEHIKSIEQSLQRRYKLGEEEWNVRSTGWHEKYSDRLYSLRRTLTRLLSVRPIVERRRMKPHHITLVLQKLEQHRLKLADLAKKFTASFDRLRLRHIHYLLTKAYAEAERKEKARELDEASFERQWFEDKTIRADLRREFFAQYRTTRRASAQ